MEKRVRIGDVWRKRLWAAVGIALVILLAGHPELRLLLPIVDVLGVDVFFGLLGLQVATIFSGWVFPVFCRLVSLLAPFLRATDAEVQRIVFLREVRGLISYGMFHWSGRPEAWFRFHAFLHVDRASV